MNADSSDQACTAFVAALEGGAEPFTQSRGESGGAEISFHAENAEGAERPGGASRPGEPTRGDGSHAEAAEFEPHAESAEFSGRARSPSAPQDSAALEADVLRRKVALAGALAGISAEDRVHALFGPPAKEAETELVATEEAFKWNRFAAAAACLDRAEAALARLKQVRREEAERIAREKVERELKKRSHAPGARLPVIIAGVSIPLRWCPPGAFTMGSDNGDSNERHTLRVNIPNGFWMGETEVTQELWRKVMGNGIKPYNDKGGSYPMENISWNDCRDFVKKLNDRADMKFAGLRFAIPTEAQWEYACRAWTTGDYGGTGCLDAMGWYDGNSGDTTHPVQGKQPNAWGLCDMHGNVWEWCANVYRDQPDGTLDNDAAVRASGEIRVLRGGSYWDYARFCRSASRYGQFIGHDRKYGLRFLAFHDGK